MITTDKKRFLGFAPFAISTLFVAALLFIFRTPAQGLSSEAMNLSIQQPLPMPSSRNRIPSSPVSEKTADLPSTILVAYDPDYPPMTSISGTLPVGHDIDLMDAVALQMGVTVVYTPVAWSDLLIGLVAGQYDAAIAGITITPEREAVMDFSLSYLDYDPDDSLGIAIVEGNALLRTEINSALWRLRADGTLMDIVAAVAADMPEIGARLPEWPACWARINDGLTDYNNLQAAVDAAQDGDMVKVAGICTGAEARDIFTQTVYISKTITLQGGYTTTNWTDSWPSRHITVLDAQREGRVMTIVGEINPLIDGLTLTGGSAHGNGFAASSGGIHIVTAGPTIRNTIIYDNQAMEHAGGVSASYSNGVIIENSQIISNTAQTGGGLDVWLSAVTVYNSVIAGNSAATGSGVYAENGDLTFWHSTIADNRSGDGAGLSLNWAPFGSPQYSIAVLTNTIIAGHTLGLSVTAGSTATLEATLWDNDLDWSGSGHMVTGTVSIQGAPAFRDPSNWDYHLTIGSDARDAGVPAAVSGDIDGEPRPQGAGFDIGADEHTFCNDVTEIPRTECQALADLFSSTAGDHWTTNTGWLANLTPCSWYGLACSEGHITQLELPGNQLSGTLPVSIADLTALQTLDFGFGGSFETNDLKGNLPEEIGELSQLQSLNLDANDFDGDLPAELGQLKNLTYLALSSNNFSGEIPVQLAAIETLQQLKIAENQLTGSIPPQLGRLRNLEDLWLNFNHLEGDIPKELGSISTLQQLVLDANAIAGPVPAELGALGSLTTLRLRSNQLQGDLPVELADLANLTDLQLDYNALTASDPGLSSFLNALDPSWADTQTVPPADLAINAISGNSIELTWTPITYTLDGGYYEVFAAIHPDGPFIQHGQTLSKTTSTFIVSDLVPNTVYYLQIRTHTPAHGVQQNDLWSAFSTIVSGTTDDIGAQTTADPSESEILDVTDAQGLTTSIQIPTGAVTTVTTLVYLEAPTTTGIIPPSYSFAGIAFDLKAYVDGVRVDPYSFEIPITVTQYYSEAALSSPEETLQLMTWDPDSERWSDAACGLYHRDLVENWLSVQVCHLSHFALLGTDYRTFLPLMVR